VANDYDCADGVRAHYWETQQSVAEAFFQASCVAYLFIGVSAVVILLARAERRV